MLQSGEAECLPALWVAHPELDENVTQVMSEHLVAAYRWAGGDAELVIFPDVGHAFGNFPGAAGDGCIARMRRFVTDQLAALAR